MVFEGLTHSKCLEARETLDLAADHVGPIQVASDCMEVVKGPKDQHMGMLCNILRGIKEKAQLRGETYFCHEGREYNYEAHSLARLASSLPAGRLVRFLTPPNGLIMPVNIIPN